MTRVWGLGVMAVVGSLCCAGVVGAQQGDTEAGATQEVEMTGTVVDGATVKIDYKLTVDGDVVDSSEGRGPLSYVHGGGQIIRGLEQELMGMGVGESKHVVVAPEHGYGQVNPDAFVSVPKDQLPPDIAPEVGMPLQGTDNEGRMFRARISEVAEDSVTLDMNHPLAGKTLEFDVEIVDIAGAQ